MKPTTSALVIAVLIGVVDAAHAEIVVTKARIGCLDIQIDGNMTDIVGRKCNGQQTCSYKAPTEDRYKEMGVKARTRTACTQGMEITYHCGQNDFHSVMVEGDAWGKPPAQLLCNPPPKPMVARLPDSEAIIPLRILMSLAYAPCLLGRSSGHGGGGVAHPLSCGPKSFLRKRAT